MTLLITDEDVRALFSMREAIDVAESAIKELDAGRAENLPRHHFYARSKAGTFFMRNFQGALLNLNVAGMRVTTDILGSKEHRPGARPFGAFLLFDLSTAALLAVVHDHELQRMRVGAETGVAARHLAPTGAKRVGLLGSGFQAETQLLAICGERPIEFVEVYSRNPERRKRFAEKMENALSIPVVPVESAERAVSGKEIILASTNSAEPVFEGRWIGEGAHVTSIVNSDQRFRRRELDNETFARAALVAVGYLQQTRHDHAADIFEAIEAGALDWKRVCELADIISGRRAGRENLAQITVFKNNGLAVEFLALAARAYQSARSQGRGEEIPSRYFSTFRSPAAT
jgi:alanine dehydrogenase